MTYTTTFPAKIPLMISMKKALNKNSNKLLTDKQYLTLRDGGCQEDLSDKTYDWYDDNKSKYTTNKFTDSILDSQSALLQKYIESKDLISDYFPKKYGEARKIIRIVAKALEEDARYIKLILSYEKNNSYDKKKKVS